MKNPVFTGAGVAIITPMYEDGSINFDELGRIVEDQIAHGTDAIVICGTTGECSTMTDEEQLAAIKNMRAEGLVPLGNWHSHPESPSRPSDEDKRLAYDKTASYMILSLMNKDEPVLNSFHIEGTDSTKEELVIE